MPEVVFPLDSTKKFTDQKLIGHNRWHPDVPTAVRRGWAGAFFVKTRFRRVDPSEDPSVHQSSQPRSPENIQKIPPPAAVMSLFPAPHSG